MAGRGADAVRVTGSMSGRVQRDPFADDVELLFVLDVSGVDGDGVPVAAVIGGVRVDRFRTWSGLPGTVVERTVERAGADEELVRSGSGLVRAGGAEWLAQVERLAFAAPGGAAEPTSGADPSSASPPGFRMTLDLIERRGRQAALRLVGPVQPGDIVVPAAERAALGRLVDLTGFEQVPDEGQIRLRPVR